MLILYEIIPLSYWPLPVMDPGYQSNIKCSDEANVIVWQSSLAILVWSMKEL